ncbi:conserved hypothetical protein [Luminiphilus syltensis NOR5-1B]|uniref:Uncharacterized protein n=1 Tax=Luminiphilus syltensis NOR5-1B TaxID=565045 RepID=B8KXJ7_9GAMM|nr:energy-coupling factor ABC transporter permease [Luminiphilus syltensis]EED35524.1 conserved hypothetical protein [Luminiphilus syltensis NOR5-1B]
MHIDPSLLPIGLIFGLGVVFLAGLVVAVFNAPWRALWHTPERLHLLAGGTLGLVLLWLMNITVVEGVVLHLLGMTTFTLVVGWCFAVIGATVALVVVTVLVDLPFAGVGAAGCLTVLIPAIVSWSLGRWLYRPRLRNPFFYILGAGFAGGALVILIDALCALVIIAIAGWDPWTSAVADIFPLLLLIAFPEAFINGMCIAALVIFYPDAVKTFDDRFYLDGDA